MVFISIHKTDQMFYELDLGRTYKTAGRLK